MKRLILGILAHVDAGKTTLSEGLLYAGGSIRKMGRVDNRDAFLDTYALERQRGITIFSKQAQIDLGDCKITLLDTPGHVDFSAEMERTLQVLDYAILVISGADGVQGHTRVLWHLLQEYRIPTFLFVNKTDQPGVDRQEVFAALQKELSPNCVDFSLEKTNLAEFQENIAVCEEKLLEQYLENGELSDEQICQLIADRAVFPCFFGSALKNTGVEEFLRAIQRFSVQFCYPQEFGARVYKIARDEQGNRLTFVKVTGGSIKTKMLLTNGKEGEDGWQEKVNQIRIYSGEKYQAVTEANAGEVCVLTGLTKTFAGEGLGRELQDIEPILEPVLTYEILLPDGCDALAVLPNFRELAEEEPQLHIVWNETTKTMQVQVMGEVQIEILKNLVKERFGLEIAFGPGRIVYKETIKAAVEGVGHFEPLRHYAEVHLRLEPLERGSGLVFDTDCSEEVLDKNWQRLVLTHLYEKKHVGVLTGSEITDMKITLCSGRAHIKHTEGGDFRQATYRAVRQGLMQAESELLEPYYEYRLEVPEAMIGRALHDMERMKGTAQIVHDEHAPKDENGQIMSVITGTAPVSLMQNYQKEVTAYTKGHGRLFCTLNGFDICHNAQEVVEQLGYEPERDMKNPCDSVFCAHGSGFVVAWDEVPKYMHLPSIFAKQKEEVLQVQEERTHRSVMDEWISTEEVDAILNQTYRANSKSNLKAGKNVWRSKVKKHGGDTYRSYRTSEHGAVVRTYDKTQEQKEYLLVDGYNIIFAWEELNELSKTTIDGARGRLLDIMCNYQALRKCELIVVFDAYRVKGHDTEVLRYHNIDVVYTREAETADAYIEKFAHEHGRKRKVTVATSDGLEQIIIRGQGCNLISAREFEKEVKMREQNLRTDYLQQQPKEQVRLGDLIDFSSSFTQEEVPDKEK